MQRMVALSGDSRKVRIDGQYLHFRVREGLFTFQILRRLLGKLLES